MILLALIFAATFTFSAGAAFGAWWVTFPRPDEWTDLAEHDRRARA